MGITHLAFDLWMDLKLGRGKKNTHLAFDLWMDLKLGRGKKNTQSLIKGNKIFK